MKKIVVLALVAVLLSSALILTSCSNCPGGFTSKSKGDCDLSVGRECEDLCGTTQALDAVTGSGEAKDNYTCDC